MDATNAIPPTGSEIVAEAQPQTEAHRPPALSYAFSRLLGLPRRLFYPPPRIPSEPTSAHSFKHAQGRTYPANGTGAFFGTPSARYGRVRSFTLTPSFSISIDDVLGGRYLPPLTAAEFQDFLIFGGGNIQDLIFYRWLNDYERVYNRLFPANSDGSLSPVLTEHRIKAIQRLHLSYLRAKETFLSSEPLYRLNVYQHEVEALNAALADHKRDFSINPAPNPQHTQSPLQGCDRPPPPSIFAGIRKSVDEMLADSLREYVTRNSGNAGRNRGIFAIVLGILIMAVGIIPELYSYSMLPGSNNRWIRFTAFAPFWVGCLTLVMGLHGVCIVIFCLGDARQLYPYELARPRISSPVGATNTTNRNGSRGDGERDSVDRESSAAGSMKHNLCASTPPSLKYAEKSQASSTLRPHPLSLQTLQGSSGEINAKDEDYGYHSGRDIKEFGKKACPVLTLPESPYWTVDFESIFPPATAYMASASSSSNSAGSSSASSSGSRRHPSSTDSTANQVEGVPTSSQVPRIPPPSRQPHPILSPLILPIPHQSALESKAATTFPSPPPRPSPAQSLTEDRALFAPLTRVLEPLILRSQWEITMRSALLSFLIAGILSGILVAVP